LYLLTEKKSAPATVAIAVSARRFLYGVTVQRMLSSRLADALEKWRELGKPKQWLFPGNRPENPITRHAVEKACREARGRSGISRLRHTLCGTMYPS